MNEIKKEGLERVLKRHEDNVSNIQAIVSRMIETGFTIQPKSLTTCPVYAPCSLNKRKRWRKKMLPG